MNDDRAWFSTGLRVLCRVAGEPVDCWEPVHVFRAADWTDAFQRALDLGRTHDRRYLNPDGEQVEWSFVEVVTLDMLGDEVTDGREVWYGVVPENRLDDIVRQLPRTPEESSAGQTGI